MMTGFEQYTRKTRRALFLEEMEQVVPWRELCALVEPHYPKAGNGRPPVGVERMLRIYFCSSGSTYRTRRSKSHCMTRP
jgi:IS5 family transposase